MSKLKARLLVTFFASLLAFLFVQQLVGIVEQASIISSLQFKKVGKGVYDGSSFYVNACRFSDCKLFENLNESCVCLKKYQNFPNVTEQCRSDLVSFYFHYSNYDYYYGYYYDNYYYDYEHYNYEMNYNHDKLFGSNISNSAFLVRISSFEAPMNFGDGEYIELTCRTAH